MNQERIETIHKTINILGVIIKRELKEEFPFFSCKYFKKYLPYLQCLLSPILFFEHNERCMLFLQCPWSNSIYNMNYCQLDACFSFSYIELDIVKL